MDIKEESCVLDFCSENEGDAKDLLKKVKTETVTSNSDIKPELQDSSCSSQNEEHDTMRFNETIKESKMKTKIEIKEEHWWIEREDSWINDIRVNYYLQDDTHEGLYSTKPPSIYEEDVSSYTSDLFSSKDLESDISFKMNVDNPECESDRKCPSAKSVVKDISAVETIVFSRTSDDGKIVSKTKCIKPHKCNICNKDFTKLSHLKTHNLTHEGIKPHKCNICNRAFTRSSHLKTHNMIHEGTQPHKCITCNKAFTAISNLKTHQLIHEGIKPHKCNICNKAFTQSSSLKKHNFIHGGIKPHKCITCNKTFTRLPSLEKHQLIHKGIKPHKCVSCNKAFTELSNMKRHKLIHDTVV